jgi:hypothetical protein
MSLLSVMGTILGWLRQGFPRLACAALWSGGMLGLTGLWSGGKHLTTVYSPLLHRQAQALVAGSFCIGTDIREIEFDQVAGERGIQQVWGLGISGYLLAISFLASGSSGELVQDRLAFGIALWAVLGLYGSALLRSGVPERGSCSPGVPRSGVSWVGLPIVVMICGGLFHLMDSKFEIYEETVGYATLAGLAVSALLLIHLRTGGWVSLIAMCLLGGLMVFVRPTSLAFGAMACACGVVRNRRAFPRWIAALVAFLVPVLGCAWTNEIRFGSATEFGHAVNGTTNEELLLVTHFPANRGDDVGIGARLMELVGAVAFDPYAGRPGTHAQVFRFQSSAVRWREGNLPALGVPVLMMVAVSLGWQWMRGNRESEGGSGRQGIRQYWLGFNLAAMVLLAIFYCRYPVLSSRYFYDFGTALANLALLPWIVVPGSPGLKGAPWVTAWAVVALCAVVDAGVRQRPQAAAKSGPPRLETRQSTGQGVELAIDPAHPCRAHCELDGVGWNCRSGSVDLCSLHALPPCRSLTLLCDAAPSLGSQLASVVRLRAHGHVIAPRIEFPASGPCRIFFDLSGPALTRSSLVFIKWGELDASGPIRLPVRLLGLEVAR